MNARLSSASSLILHIALLAMISLTAMQSHKLVPPPDPLEIEISDFADVPTLPLPVVVTDSDVDESLTDAPEFTPSDAGAPERANEPAPRPEPAQRAESASQPPVPAPPQPIVRPAPQIEAAPELAPAPVKPVAPVPVSVDPQADARPARVAAAPPAPAPPARRLDASALSQSLAASAPTASRSRLNAAVLGSAIGQAVPKGAAGLTVRQRTNLADMIRSQITPCWNPPVAEENSGHVTVVMRISLSRNGAVAGTPTVARLTGRTAANAAYANALSGSVRRAVLRCSPLKLPAELYDAWSNVELNFDPKDIS